MTGVQTCALPICGWKDGKYYALMNNVPVGTIVKLSFSSTNKSIYAKVLGQLPEMKESVGLAIRISDAAASERIAEALDKGDTKYLAAAKTLPVYFLYWTAFGGDDGSLNFRPDIYGRDARLIAALKEKRMQVASAAGCKRG